MEQPAKTPALGERGFEGESATNQPTRDSLDLAGGGAAEH